jgi:curved DNA-binding protein
MDLTHAFAELGLALHATPAQAKTAYRSLAMRWHPDVNSDPEATTRMKTINVAYEAVTTHLALRARSAAATPRPAAAHAAAGAASGAKASTGRDTGPSNASASSSSRASGFSEFDWRAGFTAAAGSRHEKPVQRTVQHSLFEAAFGCVKRIKGSANDAWTLYVRIHAGTCEGTEIAPGDIRIYASVHALPRAFKLSVQIDKHPLFQLNQDRLSVSVPMSIWRWTLGGEFTVPTLDGTTRVHLPPRAGAVLVKGQGWPHLRQPQLRQPLFVMPKRVYPHSLSEDDQRLLQALDAGARLAEVQGWQHSLQAWAESYFAQGHV